MKVVDDQRIYIIAEAIRKGIDYDTIHEITTVNLAITVSGNSSRLASFNSSTVNGSCSRRASISVRIAILSINQ